MRLLLASRLDIRPGCRSASSATTIVTPHASDASGTSPEAMEASRGEVVEVLVAAWGKDEIFLGRIYNPRVCTVR
jgi:hypothetical protein